MTPIVWFVVVANVCYNPNTIWTYFSCAIATLFSFSSHKVDIPFYLCSIIPFHYKKEKDQCEYRDCSYWGQPGYILINGEFVAIHASIMRWNETWSVAKSLQLRFKNSLNRHVKPASSNRFFCCFYVLVLCLCLCNLIAGLDFLLLQINMILITVWVCFLKIM